MKNDVLILSKTKMHQGHVCVGGITLEGDYVRLMDEYGEYQSEKTEFEPLQIWEIEYSLDPDKTPPHVENILVKTQKMKKTLGEGESVKTYLQKMDVLIWEGSPDILFYGLLNWDKKGFINAEKGIPDHSVGFWISDKDLEKQELNSFGKIDYKYPLALGSKFVKYAGTEEPVDVIPAGTLMRVSLAKWWKRSNDVEERCYLQLSGWYNL